MEIQSFGALSKPARQVHFRGPIKPISLLEGLRSELKDLSPLVGRLPVCENGEPEHWLISLGAVYVNSSRVMDPEFQITLADLIRVHLEPKRYSLDKKEIQKRIVFENENFLVVDKPSGLPMHPTLDNFWENLASGFEYPVYVTHRLDVPTSGLCVLAKTKKYQSEFNKLISRREIRKIYQAVVMKPVEPGLLRHFMKVTVKAPKEVFGEIPTGDPAIMAPPRYDECLLKVVSTISKDEGLFELKIELLTGRTHQIRAQLAFIGSPIIGDMMYGGIKSETFGLRASELSFKCPVSGENFSFKLSDSGVKQVR